MHFGRDRRGNAASVVDLGEEMGFNVSQVASVRDTGEAISSTRIREALAAGDLDAAVRWSGHPIWVSGTVERGRELGRQLGFPTANLTVPPGKVSFAPGVYAGWARAGDDWLPSVANLGYAPTVADGRDLRLEVHLLDGDHDLYGRRLEVALGTRLRAEQKFSSEDELVAAIEGDCARARAWVDAAPETAHPGRLAHLSGLGPA